MAKGINIFSYDADYQKMLNNLKIQRSLLEVNTNFGTVLIEDLPVKDKNPLLEYQKQKLSKYSINKFRS